jgi:hypothetical protein
MSEQRVTFKYQGLTLAGVVHVPDVGPAERRIAPIPDHMRGHVVPSSIQMFPAETAQSMYDFRAEDVVGNTAPRPLLLLHSASDSVTPVEQSIGLFQHADQPTELHLFADTDHFMFAESNTRVLRIVQDWLAEYFALDARAAAA